MISTNNQNQLKKRIIFALVIILFIGVYIIINRSVNSLQMPSANPIIYSENENVELNRIISFSQNSTIISAFTEINKGYLNLKENHILNSGFAASLTSGMNGSVLNEENNKEKKLYPYLYAIYKYHPFFTTYAKSLNAVDLYLIEPEQNVILYSTLLDEKLLLKTTSFEFNSFIEKIKSASSKDRIIMLPLSGTKEVLYGTLVYDHEQLIGILIVRLLQPQS